MSERGAGSKFISAVFLVLWVCIHFRLQQSFTHTPEAKVVLRTVLPLAWACDDTEALPCSFHMQSQQKSVSKGFYEIGLRGLTSLEIDWWKIHLSPCSSLGTARSHCGYTSPASSG